MLRFLGFWLLLLSLVSSVLYWFGVDPVIVVLVDLGIVGWLVTTIFRGHRALVKMQALLADGRPDDLLRTIDTLFDPNAQPSSQAPLLLFRAAGLSMQGRWAQAQRVLDGVELAELPEPVAMWEVAYYGTRFDCCVFSDRIEDARELVANHIEPIVDRAEHPALIPSLQSCRAVLEFCDGELTASEHRFVTLLEEESMPKVARGMIHYFLGRIALDRDDEAHALEHFAECGNLAAKTWLPEGIDAVLKVAKLVGAESEVHAH